MKILPSDNSYNTFCDLTSGYRLFSVLREAHRFGIIDRVAEGDCRLEGLAERCGMRTEEGKRFIDLLLGIGLLEQYDGQLSVSRFAATYLGSASPLNQRHVLEFEVLLTANWDRLGTILSEGQGTLIVEQSQDEYRRRLALFQQAMGEAAAVRSQELWEALSGLPERGLIIDIGAGDGSYLTTFLKGHPGWQALACDLPDVCAAAQGMSSNENLQWHPLNILEPEALKQLVNEWREKADVLLLSNLIHCYPLPQIRFMLQQLHELPAGDGLLVIHDFFRDANEFGAFYDLHMLVNTWNGSCHTLAETIELLKENGFQHHYVLELPSRSHAVVACRIPVKQDLSSLYPVRKKAGELGFYAAVDLDPAQIKSEPWVRAKCSYGCSRYGRRWSCPPNTMGSEEFREFLGCYSRALLVAGQPPLRAFQEQLLELEKTSFLSGFPKALAFTGGPCCWCESCPDDRCAFPEKRRPSLEACGCDVFALAETAGIKLKPLRNSDEFVQYIGLLLVD